MPWRKKSGCDLQNRQQQKRISVQDLQPWCVSVCKFLQSCLILCDPMEFSPPASSVHGISQARLLQWVAMLSSRGSSQPKDQTQVSGIAGKSFTVWATREALCNSLLIPNKFIIAGEIPGYIFFQLNVLEACTGTFHNLGAGKQKKSSIHDWDHCHSLLFSRWACCLKVHPPPGSKLLCSLHLNLSKLYWGSI